MTATKIIATIGPRTADRDMLAALHQKGMSVARLNGSHADLDWHRTTIALIRETLPDVPILLDIPGRKIRTGLLSHEPTFKTGDRIILSSETGHDGQEKVSVNYPQLHEDLSAGDTILADDGTLRFTVEKVSGRDIFCRTEVDGTLKSSKGINVPMVALKTPMVTDRDHEMVAFAKDNGVDFIGISFVESAAHIEAIREIIRGSWPRVVSKVENRGGMQNLDEIVRATDAVMIDRGDLSVETSLETLAISQKQIIRAANAVGVPVIVATEMLHTMIENPFPTKAEVSDITNAILDGAAATMLSGETAIGKYPLETLETMQRISATAAGHFEENTRSVGAAQSGREGVPEAMEDAIATICRSIAVTKIVAITISGYAARMLSARRPDQPIIAVSNDQMAARSFHLMAGVEGVYLDIPFPRDSTDHVATCLRHLWSSGKLHEGDLVLVTAVGFPRSGNRMNLIQTHHISDLIETLDWKNS